MSVIRVDNVGPSSGGTAKSLRGIAAAWANLDGTGTIVLRDSQNVSGVVDEGTGDYSFNFSSAMSAATYSYTSNSGQGSAGNAGVITGDFGSTASLLRIVSIQGTSRIDFTLLTASIHGDLA